MRLRWRYDVEGGRDLRLDLLRGFCLFAMTIDHVQSATGKLGPESWVYRASPAHAIGVISAAEVFVFLSGLVMGSVYVRVVRRHGLRTASIRALRRARKLYLVLLGLGVAYVLVATVATVPGVPAGEKPLDYIVGILTLRNDHTGLIAMYLLFVALAPIAFFALEEGKTGWVLGTSVAVWAGNLLCPRYFDTPFQLYFEFAVFV
jgi:hypothetical protein